MKKNLSVFAAIVLVLGIYTFSWGDINDGLVAYYPFDGNTNDESGNGHHGTLHDFGAVWTTGKIEGALEFNGGTYVEVANSADFNSLSALTIAAWVNTSTFTWAQGIVYKGDMYWEPFFLRLDGDSTVRGYVRNSSGTPISVSGGSVSVNTWHHVAMAYDGAFIRIYLDGFKVSSISQSGTTYSDSESLFIGTWFNGIIDEVRIYNRALSESEIQELYNESIIAIIDINPDTLNLKSKGNWITAYIELPEDYTVADIGIDSIILSKINGNLLDPSLYTVGPFRNRRL